MSKWSTTDLPNLNGRVIVVTGASSGIGQIAARALAGAGARVVLAVRDVVKGRRVAEEMRGDVEVREATSRSELASVRAFAGAWDGPLDVLINNAGVMDVPLGRTSEGFDVQTATNSLGPFLLTNLLLPHITDRVVWVPSQLHRMGHLHVEDLGWQSRAYDSMAAYRDSKLQVALYSRALQSRLGEAGSGVTSILAHPGIATTALASHSSAGRINRLSFLLNDPEHGALPLLYAATAIVPGNAYVGPDGVGSVKGHPTVRKPGRAGLDMDAAQELWAAASDLTGLTA